MTPEHAARGVVVDASHIVLEVRVHAEGRFHRSLLVDGLHDAGLAAVHLDGPVERVPVDTTQSNVQA